MDIESDDIVCNVCMHTKDNIKKCDHCTWHMCNECYSKYTKEKDFCPQCKEIIKDENIIRNKNIALIFRSQLFEKHKFKVFVLSTFCICWSLSWILFGCKILKCQKYKYNYNITSNG